MKIVSLPYRTAISEALNGHVVYSGIGIPTYEEYVQVTASRPIGYVPKGTEEVGCYIILLNQTSNDNSAKCTRNDDVSIQAQITTEWTSNKGGSKLAEEIAELVVNRLFDADGLFNILTLDEPLSLWKGELESIQNINYDLTSSRVWITQLLITGSITQG